MNETFEWCECSGSTVFGKELTNATLIQQITVTFDL